MNKRMKVMLGVLAALLAVVALYSYSSMSEMQDAARHAREGLERSRQLAELIEQNRQRPTLAASQERLQSEITRLIESAASSAGIASVSRMSHSPGGRIGNTPYMEKPTQVTLKKVTLKQVVAMTHKLVGGEGGLHARSLTLTAPRGSASGDEWDVELVVTYLIYEPQATKAPGASAS